MSRQNERKWLKYYNELYVLVYGILRNKVQNIHDAEEIMQDVFLDFYRKFDEVSNPRAWILGALNLKIINYYRTKKKIRDEVELHRVVNDMNFMYVNGLQDARIVINSVFENIHNFAEEQDKIIFDLIAYQRYQYQEVARLLGLSKRQVAYRYHTTIKKILSELKKRGIHHLEDLL
jgi:RNA polymerase sigma factor (sigma-70 family)